MGRAKGDYDLRPGPVASRCKLDPLAGLAAAAIVKALADYGGADILLALDSLCWWLSDAPIWLEALDIAPADNPDFVFIRLLGGGRNGKASRFIAGRNPEAAAA